MRESQEGGGGEGGTVRVRLCARGTRRGFSTPIPSGRGGTPGPERTSEQEGGGGGEDEDGGGWWRDGEKQRRRDLSSAVTLCSSPLSPAAVRSSHFSSFFSYRHSPLSPRSRSSFCGFFPSTSLDSDSTPSWRRYWNTGIEDFDVTHKFASLFNLLNHIN